MRDAAYPAILGALGCAAFGFACDGGERQEPPGASSPPPVSSAPSVAVFGDLVDPYLPDGGDQAPPSAPRPEPARPARGACPGEMVDVGGRFCIDRYEMSLEETTAGRALSPYYHPTAAVTVQALERFTRIQQSATTFLGQHPDVPEPPFWQKQGGFSIRARSRPGVKPNGYLNRELADQACQAAGKRLCSRDEWVIACRGERGEKFPYGPSYRDGACNVFRGTHPAARLHGDASRNHLDPRLNLVSEDGDPLLRPTGGTPQCTSRWGDDAIHDMVGNLDEWVAEPHGVFVGGFFSRATREGCEAAVSSHAPEYFDYSLGARCCASG